MPKADKFCGISGSEAEGIFQRDLEHVHAIADRRGHVECRARLRCRRTSRNAHPVI